MMRILLVLLFLAPAAGWAQVAPDARWRTLETDHFRITFGPGLEALARRAAGHAEAAYARFAEELAPPPRGRIDVVLTDDVDLSNGTATPLPSNRIVLYARPPVDVLGLDYFDDWMEEVVVHELTHIFHLDRTGRLGGALRGLFGRVPFPWPFFPVVGTPAWSTEGLATMVESRVTGAGRVYGAYHEMVVRTAALEGRLASIDQIAGYGPAWPGGSTRYVYGSLFFEHLAQKYGAEAHGKLIDRTARAWIPPILAFDRVAKQALGESFTSAYREWSRGLEARYHALADSLRAEGLTATERLTTAGYHAYHPRVAPDGRVAYVASDGRSTAVTRVLDPRTGESRVLARRNDLGPVSWFPEGRGLLTSQLELDGPYRVFGDLVLVDERGEKRLTRAARLDHPDVAPDGRRVVAVHSGAGTNALVIHDLQTGERRAITSADPEVHWAYPRWAPDGARLAAGRWQAGAYDVVVLDSAGTVLHELTGDRAIDTAPAWSPDGRYVVFSSDRSGIPNLYAYDLGPIPAGDDEAPASRLRQVTHLLTGAFYPDVSPDGKWVYFSGYHADGFHIERIAFDPATWRAPPPVRPELEAISRAAKASGAPGAPGAPGGPEAGPAIATAPVRPYSAVRSLLPRFWTPVLAGDASGAGTFFGAAISGQDLVGRHAYGLKAAYQGGDGLFGGSLAYRYAGFGNPVLGLTVSRSWDGTRFPLQEAVGARLFWSEDALGLTASLLRRRWRSTASLTLGAEGVRERYRLFDAPGYGPYPYPGTDFVGLFGGAAFANARSYPFSISGEDGVALSLTGRRRWDLEPWTDPDGAILDRSYDEAHGRIAAYKALPGFGFANHVLAARASARWQGGSGAGTFGIGGASGESADLGITEIGGPFRFLPVRGFGANARRGTRAWSTSLEYRFPLALIGRGYRLWPVFLDRLSAAAFLDAGDAWCSAEQLAQLPRCTEASRAPLVGAGAELALDLGLFASPPFRVRSGFGYPVRGGGAEARPVFYLQFGPSF